MSFRILQPGTSMLEVGPPQARRRFGIPVGGPADPISCAYANALIGAAAEATAFEIAFSGPALVAECDMAFAVAGASVDLWIDGQTTLSNSSRGIRAGQTLRIGRVRRGHRCYLASLPGDCKIPVQSLPDDWFTHVGTAELRVLPGPQRDWFGPDAGCGIYRVSEAANRMGLRLHGPPLSRPAREMVSEAVATGAVQVANDGQPILIGIDGQTIGGYPKLAHVIAADMPVVGQLEPGRSVYFRWVSLAEAEIAWAESAALLRERLHRIRVLRE